MKHVILAFFVFLASMPSQASCESLHASQEAPQDQHGEMPAGHDMSHAGMSHTGMDHSGMDHTGMEKAMDCCDHDPADPTGDCESMSTCRAPVFNFVMADLTPLDAVDINRQQQFSSHAPAPASRFTAPPLRPPIS